MTKLKEAYDIKRQLINADISELGDIINTNLNINTININPDNTIYLESNDEIDSITNDLDLSVLKWINRDIEAQIGMVYSTLPISNNSCIIRI